jgi:hypothetical protein
MSREDDGYDPKKSLSAGVGDRHCMFPLEQDMAREGIASPRSARLLLLSSFMETITEDKGMKGETFDDSKMWWSLREVIAVQPLSGHQSICNPTNDKITPVITPPLVDASYLTRTEMMDSLLKFKTPIFAFSLSRLGSSWAALRLVLRIFRLT